MSRLDSLLTWVAAHLTGKGYAVPRTFDAARWRKAVQGLTPDEVRRAVTSLRQADSEGEAMPSPESVRRIAERLREAGIQRVEVRLGAMALGPWSTLRYGESVGARRSAIELLDKACAETEKCSTQERCAADCAACIDRIWRRANQLAQEVMDGRRPEGAVPGEGPAPARPGPSRASGRPRRDGERG